MFISEQWIKCRATLTTDSALVRLSMVITESNETCLDELLTVDSKFTPHGKTTIQWTSVDFSQGQMQTRDVTVRFKFSNIREKFLDVWQNVQKQMKDRQSKNSEYILEYIPFVHNFDKKLTNLITHFYV